MRVPRARPLASWAVGSWRVWGRVLSGLAPGGVCTCRYGERRRRRVRERIGVGRGGLMPGCLGAAEMAGVVEAGHSGLQG